MKIDYEHASNPHGEGGPSAAWAKITSGKMPSSVLDVGCGIGTWIKAAMSTGVGDVFGLDGVQIPPDQLLFPADKFACSDLTKPVDVGRRFDLVLCLEVAEHLEIGSSSVLIETLTKHSDTVIFSAACPGQPGQHYVNCQWPEFWQRLFNMAGFVCEDAFRSMLWDDPGIEFWYKQNMFIARKDSEAGREPRLKTIIHPEMHTWLVKPAPSFHEHLLQIECGRMPVDWYIRTPFIALYRKLVRKCLSRYQ